MNRLSSLSRFRVLGTALGILLGSSAGADAQGISPTARAGPAATLVLPTKQPTSLRGLPETSIIVVGGRSTTVATLRTQLRLIAFRGMPAMHTLDQKSGGGSMRGIMGSFGDRTVGTGLTATAGQSPRFVNQSSSVSRSANAQAPQLIDAEYCKTHAPIVTGVRGKVTSGGYAVIEGACFGGTNGAVSMIGKFDGGAINLTVQAWTDTSITAAIPDLRGVYDQKVGFQVTRGTYVSTAESATFIAARETLTLPAHYITPVTCNQIWNAGFCMDGRAFHDELSSTASSTDVWQATAPTGWVLNSLATSPGIGSVSYTGGFDQGPPDSATWSMAWTAGVSRTVTTSTDYGFFVSHSTDSYYGESYAMSITATGPAGTMTQ